MQFTGIKLVFHEANFSREETISFVGNAHHVSEAIQTKGKSIDIYHIWTACCNIFRLKTFVAN